MVNLFLQIASRISPQMKFGPLSKPFLQVPVMSLAQKVVVSEPGHEPQLEGRSEMGADLYKAMLEDTGQPTFAWRNALLRSCTSDEMVARSACLVWSQHHQRHKMCVCCRR